MPKSRNQHTLEVYNLEGLFTMSYTIIQRLITFGRSSTSRPAVTPICKKTRGRWSGPFHVISLLVQMPLASSNLKLWYAMVVTLMSRNTKHPGDLWCLVLVSSWMYIPTVKVSGQHGELFQGTSFLHIQVVLVTSVFWFLMNNHCESTIMNHHYRVVPYPLVRSVGLE